MTSSESQQLFERTILGGYEDDGAWEAVFSLQRDGSRGIFDSAVEWSKADEPLKRARAAAILAQLRSLPGQDETHGEQTWLFRDEAFTHIVQMLQSEIEPVVLANGIEALGHIGNEIGIPIIIQYSNHPNGNVRFSVAYALGCFPNESRSVAGLIVLTRDEDPDVRDWSVFGLGVQGHQDSSEIREALYERLHDADEDVREEAAVGLAKRQDLRLLPTLMRMLDQPSVNSRVAEAASALLGLVDGPAEWMTFNYKDALMEKFGTVLNRKSL